MLLNYKKKKKKTNFLSPIDASVIDLKSTTEMTGLLNI